MKTEVWSKQKALEFLQINKNAMYTDYFLKKYVRFFDKAISHKVQETIHDDTFTTFLLNISLCPKNVTALNKLYRSASCDTLFAFYTRHLLLENLFSEPESDLSYCIEMPEQDEFDQYTYLLYNFYNLITSSSYDDESSCP